jgi:surfeit locus 1 family protein
MIPTKLHGYSGYECVVPLVTSENEDGSDQQGVLLSLGFIPKEYAHPSTRYKVESSDWQDFSAYVSTLDEFQSHNVLSSGNIGGRGEGKWNYADIEKMAKHTGFKNWKNAQFAVLEQVRPNSTADERSIDYRDLDSSYQQDYPYVKTLAGALQAP